MNSLECPPQGGFVRQLGCRLRLLWPAKMMFLTFGMMAFFTAYFWVLNHPIFQVTTMPLTAVDRFVDFRPGALPLYLSLWLYVSLAFALLKDRRELLAGAAAAVVLSVAGLGIFFLWPTAVPDRGTDWASHPAFAFLQTVDASGNACPSLHVAFAVFAAIRMARLLREMRAPAAIRVGNWLWCLGITYSTLAIRQHVALDALAGALLGAITAVPHFRRSSAAAGSRPTN